MTEPWVCEKCGSCCQDVGLWKPWRWMDRGDGACIFLTHNNLCSIYERRPWYCRADKRMVTPKFQRALCKFVQQGGIRKHFKEVEAGTFDVIKAVEKLTEKEGGADERTDPV